MNSLNPSLKLFSSIMTIIILFHLCNGFWMNCQFLPFHFADGGPWIAILIKLSYDFHLIFMTLLVQPLYQKFTHFENEYLLIKSQYLRFIWYDNSLFLCCNRVDCRPRDWHFNEIGSYDFHWIFMTSSVQPLYQKFTHCENEYLLIKS